MSDPRPIRVLHLRTVHGTGGGPDKTVLKSCRLLAARGHVAHAFYMLDRKHDTGRLQALGEELGVRLTAAMEDGPVCPATVRALNAALAAGRYDIVHTHEYKSNVLALLLRPWHGYQIVATAHGYNRTTLREGLYYALERLTFRHLAGVIAPNRAMFGLLRGFGVPPSRLHVIHNGIETAGRTPPPRPGRSRKTRLLYLGRLSTEKDPANAVHALAALADLGLDVEITLAGDGPDRPAVEALADRLDLADRVHLPGFVADVMGLLANADILISPSRTECMPNAVLEAMWAGVPVAATDVGGVGEMIHDGVHGLLCPPRDPDALARILQRLIADAKLRRRLAENAHQRLIEKFTFEKRMERVLDLYLQLTQETGARPA